MYLAVNRALVTALAAHFTGVRAATRLPADLVGALPVIQPRRFGGTDDVLTLDAANVDLDVWAGDEASAEDLANQVRTWVRVTLPGTAVTDGTSSGVVARTGTLSAPAERPSDNPAVFRVGASYRITFHSH